MFSWYYIIKKNNFGGLNLIPVPASGGLFLAILYIIIPIIALLISICVDDDVDKDWFLAFMIVGMLLFLLYGINFLNEILKQKKLRNFKINGGGVVKKAKVTSIGKIKAGKDKLSEIDVYYVEAEDSGMTYYSYGYTDGDVLGTSIVDLQSLYDKYGFAFDENQSQKRDLLRKLDECIAKKKVEIENSGSVSETLENELGNLNEDRKLIDEGYVPSYWQVYENKVSVGDKVDVYFNPDKPERYWVDIDFLF